MVKTTLHIELFHRIAGSMKNRFSVLRVTSKTHLRNRLFTVISYKNHLRKTASSVDKKTCDRNPACCFEYKKGWRRVERLTRRLVSGIAVTEPWSGLFGRSS